MKALIVHSRRTGLGLIRSLGEQGFEIFAADTFKAQAFYSKYVSKSFIVPNMIKEGQAKFIEKLLQIGKENQDGEKIFLFTGSDDYLMIFCKNWEILSAYFIPTFETELTRLLESLEKGKMYKLAERAGVPYPKSYYNIEDTSSVTSFPVIIKPSLKKTDKVDVVKEAFRIKKCDNKTELNEAISMLMALKVEYVVQQYIPGEDDSLFTAGLFSYKGNLVAIGCGRKLRQFPPRLGECSYGELLESPKIEAYSKSLCNESGITGICQIEFKKYNNEYYLMEINPRPWSWNSLMTYAGVNLPKIACDTILEKKLHHTQKAVLTKGNWMYITRDFKYNVIKNRNVSFTRYIKQVFSSEMYAYWSLKDPLPFFIDLYYFIKYG